MHRDDPSLPPEVHKCPYCNFYASPDNLERPTSKITKHITYSCPEAQKEAQQKNEGIRVRYRIIKDADEIRENVIKSLPHIHHCRFCVFRLKDATENVRIQHLVEYHQEALYKLR